MTNTEPIKIGIQLQASRAEQGFKLRFPRSSSNSLANISYKVSLGALLSKTTLTHLAKVNCNQVPDFTLALYSVQMRFFKMLLLPLIPAMELICIKGKMSYLLVQSRCIV